MLMRVVTNSERGTSACERKWAFRYVEGLAPKGESPAALRQGSLVHRLLDAWYRNGCLPPQSCLWLYGAVIEPWLDQRRAAVAEAVAAYEGLMPDEMHRENNEIAAESWGMFAHYVEHHWQHDSTEWEILGVGTQVGRWLVHPEHGGPILDRPPATELSQGQLVTLTGKKTWRRWAQGGEMDLLIRERSTGLVWIVEHKTTAERDLIRYGRKLRLDPQIRCYAWLLRDPIASISDVKVPVEVAGVIYNTLRKSVPRVPEMLAPPKPTKATPHPVSPGLSRDKRIDTTRAVYLQTILANGLDPGRYADVLDALSNRQFFARERYPLGQGDLDDWQTDAGWWALTRIEAQRRPYHPRQVASCVGPAANPCPYSRICLEDGAQVRIGYQLRSVRHEELRGDLSGPWAITPEREKAAKLGLPFRFKQRDAEPSNEWKPETDPFA
jgi:hypothetical protein